LKEPVRNNSFKISRDCSELLDSGVGGYQGQTL